MFPSKIKSFLRMLQPWLIGLYFAQHDSYFLAVLMIIIAAYYFEDFIGLLRGGGVMVKEVKIRKEDAPPEVRAFFEEMIKKEKCDDPHCSNCHGFADEKGEELPK